MPLMEVCFRGELGSRFPSMRKQGNKDSETG